MSAIVKAGAEYQHGEVKRDPKMSPWEQIESLEEDYEGFEWISVHGGKITFKYLSRKE